MKTLSIIVVFLAVIGLCLANHHSGRGYGGRQGSYRNRMRYEPQRQVDEYYVAVLHPAESDIEHQQFGANLTSSFSNENETMERHEERESFFDVNRPEGLFLMYANLTRQVSNQDEDSCYAREQYLIRDLTSWEAGITYELWLHNMLQVTSATINFGVVGEEVKDIEGPAVIDLLQVSALQGSNATVNENGYILLSGEINSDVLNSQGMSHLQSFQPLHLIVLLERSLAYLDVRGIPLSGAENISQPLESGDNITESTLARPAAEFEGDIPALNVNETLPSGNETEAEFESGFTEVESEIQLLGQIGQVDFRTFSMMNYGFEL